MSYYTDLRFASFKYTSILAKAENDADLAIRSAKILEHEELEKFITYLTNPAKYSTDITARDTSKIDPDTEISIEKYLKALDQTGHTKYRSMVKDFLGVVSKQSYKFTTRQLQEYFIKAGKRH